MKFYSAIIQTIIAISISWTALEIRSVGTPNVSVEVPAPVTEKIEVIAKVPAPTIQTVEARVPAPVIKTVDVNVPTPRFSGDLNVQCHVRTRRIESELSEIKSAIMGP